MKTEHVLLALDQWVAQRPGLDFANYGDVSSYRAEMRSITKYLHDYRALRSHAATLTITAKEWRSAFRAYSGRLVAVEREDGSIALTYNVGQYFPTEYRRAACAVVASAIRDYYAICVPDHYPFAARWEWLKQRMRRQFGVGIQKRWFN